MNLFLILPIFVIFITVGGIIVSSVINIYIIPFLGLSQENNVGIGTGIIIVFASIFLYYIIFGKKIESDKFKDFLDKNI